MFTLKKVADQQCSEHVTTTQTVALSHFVTSVPDQCIPSNYLIGINFVLMTSMRAHAAQIGITSASS